MSGWDTPWVNCSIKIALSAAIFTYVPKAVRLPKSAGNLAVTFGFKITAFLTFLRDIFNHSAIAYHNRNLTNNIFTYNITDSTKGHLMRIKCSGFFTFLTGTIDSSLQALAIELKRFFESKIYRTISKYNTQGDQQVGCFFFKFKQVHCLVRKIAHLKMSPTYKSLGKKLFQLYHRAKNIHQLHMLCLLF